MQAHGLDVKEGKCTHNFLLVGSMIRQGLGFTVERLVWINVEERDDGRASVQYVGSTNV